MSDIKVKVIVDNRNANSEIGVGFPESHRVINAETGENISGVQEVNISFDALSFPIVTLKIVNPEIEVVK